MKRYIIFGANGFIGAALVEKLSKDNYVYAIDRYSKKEIFKTNKNVELIKNDVLKGNKTVLNLINGKIDGVVWAVGGAVPADSLEKEKDILDLTVPVIDLMKPFMEAKLPIIFTSSAGMMYVPQKNKLTEKSRVDPWTWYGLQKLMLEKTLLLLSKELGNSNLKILRISSVYGEKQPTERNQGVVAKLMKSIVEDKPFVLYGSDLARRDYVYVSDLAEIISRFLKEKTKHQIYNISTGVGVSLSDVIKEIEKISKKKIVILKKDKRKIDPVHIDVSNNLLLKEFADLRFTPLEIGLANTLTWYMNKK